MEQRIEIPGLEDIGALCPRPDLDETWTLPVIATGPTYRSLNAQRVWPTQPTATLHQRLGESPPAWRLGEDGYRSRVVNRHPPRSQLTEWLDAVLLVAGMILGADALIHILQGAF